MSSIHPLWRHHRLLKGAPQIVTALLYGSGLRLMEGLRLRVKDIDFDRLAIFVRSGKGGKDRVSMLPSDLVEPLTATRRRCESHSNTIVNVGWPVCIFPMRSRASIRTHLSNGRGSGGIPKPRVQPRSA